MLVTLLTLAAPTVTAPGQGNRVLVIVNTADVDSVRIGRYYAERRGVPKENLVLLRTSTEDEIPEARFAREIEKPIQGALSKSRNPIDFLLFVRGVPIRIHEGGYSVDSILMSEGLKVQKLPVGQQNWDIAENPYYGKNEPFRHSRFGIYLSCRLDGYTPEQARSLVDRSLAAKRTKGPFLLNKAQNRRTQGYGVLQATLDSAASLLTAKGMVVRLVEGREFGGSSAPLAGYASWGSNDAAFNQEAYASLRFFPGAIAETFVSTSGRTFRPAKGGQSLIADLIAAGVTGVKGYVSEPYTIALARADVLFDRYTSGRNLAESFYAASPVVHWKDVVIGDPLCAPYR